MKRQKSQIDCNWAPYTRATWTIHQINKWVELNGEYAFHKGERYAIKAKKISVSKYYTVWFEVVE